MRTKLLSWTLVIPRGSGRGWTERTESPSFNGPARISRAEKEKKEEKIGKKRGVLTLFRTGEGFSLSTTFAGKETVLDGGPYPTEKAAEEYAELILEDYEEFGRKLKYEKK
jgi:hypothetical protein